MRSNSSVRNVDGSNVDQTFTAIQNHFKVNINETIHLDNSRNLGYILENGIFTRIIEL